MDEPLQWEGFWYILTYQKLGPSGGYSRLTTASEGSRPAEWWVQWRTANLIFVDKTFIFQLQLVCALLSFSVVDVMNINEM
jgi:hypothetical protein